MVVSKLAPSLYQNLWSWDWNQTKRVSEKGIWCLSARRLLTKILCCSANDFQPIQVWMWNKRAFKKCRYNLEDTTSKASVRSSLVQQELSEFCCHSTAEAACVVAPRAQDTLHIFDDFCFCLPPCKTVTHLMVTNLRGDSVQSICFCTEKNGCDSFLPCSKRRWGEWIF